MPHPSPFGPEASRGELAPRAALESRATASEGGGKPKFASDTGFHTEVKRRVLEYFEHTVLSPPDSSRMYVKTAVLLLWFVASYALLVFAATTWWQGALLSVSLALAMAGIGFGVQHDANHGAGSPVSNVAITTGGRTASAPEWVELLDGGADAYPRMLLRHRTPLLGVWHLHEGATDGLGRDRTPAESGDGAGAVRFARQDAVCNGRAAENESTRA